jgi:transcription termination factor Rho
MTEICSGILKVTKNRAGALYNPAEAKERISVSAELIRAHKLPEGASVTGAMQKGRKGPELTDIKTVCGLTPEEFQKRTPFRQLVAINPCERFDLGASGDASMRIVDLVAPIGKGTRGLIVAPPKAGKTMLLEKIANAVVTDGPGTRLIMLLIDERPEEVTHFRRVTAGGEVFASSSDQPAHKHVELVELMLAHIRTELECGRDVVVLLDGLTRLVRAFNLEGSAAGRGRTLSGGLQADALEIPRRFFGLARNIENGGSVTILSTVLVDTGSRMDQFIYEELKGTGNSEIVLDRSLAEAYIFPAINVTASGTRKEEQLYEPDESLLLIRLRRELAGLPPREAMELLLRLVATYPTNEELLKSIAG